MYLLIPFFLILGSAGGIFFIVWNKIPQLNGLAESESSGSIPSKTDWLGLIYNLCPEVIDWAKGINFASHKETWLIEMEKFLRRLRVVSLRMDRFSDSLIKKIRENIPSVEDTVYIAKEEARDSKIEATDANKEKNSKEEFKKSEQRLILEIAKNPKSALLYEELGDLYFHNAGYQDAKESYEAAIELLPQNEELKKKLSQALAKINQSSGSQN